MTEQEVVTFKPSEEFVFVANKVFTEQKEKILELLPFAEVYHIGGTVIPGLITKGDLDINVRITEKDFNSAVEVLKQMYEINQLHNWTNTYASFKDDTNLEIDFGAQLTVIDSPDDYFLEQRDMLLKNPELIKKLNLLKLKYEGKPMDEYRNEKNKFFEKMMTKNLQ